MSSGHLDRRCGGARDAREGLFGGTLDRREEGEPLSAPDRMRDGRFRPRPADSR